MPGRGALRGTPAHLLLVFRLLPVSDSDKLTKAHETKKSSVLALQTAFSGGYTISPERECTC